MMIIEIRTFSSKANQRKLIGMITKYSKLKTPTLAINIHLTNNTPQPHLSIIDLVMFQIMINKSQNMIALINLKIFTKIRVLTIGDKNH
jgi:hypothetical protein